MINVGWDIGIHRERENHARVAGMAAGPTRFLFWVPLGPEDRVRVERQAEVAGFISVSCPSRRRQNGDPGLEPGKLVGELDVITKY